MIQILSWFKSGSLTVIEAETIEPNTTTSTAFPITTSSLKPDDNSTTTTTLRFDKHEREGVMTNHFLFFPLLLSVQTQQRRHRRPQLRKYKIVQTFWYVIDFIECWSNASQNYWKTNNNQHINYVSFHLHLTYEVISVALGCILGCKWTDSLKSICHLILIFVTI